MATGYNAGSERTDLPADRADPSVQHNTVSQ